MTNCSAGLIGATFIVAVLSAPIYAKNQVDLWEGVVIGDLKPLERALEAGLDPNVREPNGSTPLIIAAMWGQTSVVSFLVENKAKLNIQNNQGTTALHVAAFFGYPEAVELLLAAGAASDIRNDDGQTPLDSVSGPWSPVLEGIYAFFDVTFQMGLDIDRIREVRPEVHNILRTLN